jgi:hypothetical protein
MESFADLEVLEGQHGVSRLRNGARLQAEVADQLRKLFSIMQWS